MLLTCYHGGRFCRTDILEDHKRLITINNYFSQDWNDFNLAVRISSLRFSFGRDWNDKFQLRCSNDKFQLRCSNSTESDQSHARRPEDRNCHPVDRGRLRIPKHITNEMHEWVKTLGWGRRVYRVAMIKTEGRQAQTCLSRTPTSRHNVDTRSEMSPSRPPREVVPLPTHNACKQTSHCAPLKVHRQFPKRTFHHQ